MPVRPLLLLFVPLAALAQNASLQGTIVNTADGQPLAGVHVRLVPAPMDISGDVYGAMSDRAGHFSMASVTPGAYLIFSDRNGFMTMHSARRGSRSGVTIKPGEKIDDFKIEMSPEAILRGRVLDQYGDPMPSVRVQISPASSADQFGNSGFTDDRGEFRVVTAPGRFYIEALPNRQGMRAGSKEIRTDGTSTLVYTATYYPGTASKDHATAVDAKAGVEVSGIDIRFAATSAMTISGQITGIPPGAQVTPVIWILSKADGMTFSRFSTATADVHGRFTIGPLESQSYTLLAQWITEDKRLCSAPQRIQLDGTDVSGIVLALGTPGEINGTVEVPGLKPAERSQLTAKMTVNLRPVDFPIYNMRAEPAVVDKEGTFHAGSLAPIHYKVELTNLPDHAYVKTILLDGVPVSGSSNPEASDEADFSSVTSSSAATIILSLDAGVISGSIHDTTGAVMTRSFVNVFLAGDPNNLNSAKHARVNPDGSYQLLGVRPGKYRIFAVDAMERPGMSLAEISSELGAKAEEIEVKEGDRITRNLTPLNEKKEP